MPKIKTVTLTETYTYDVEIAIDDNENLHDFIMELPLIIERNKTYIKMLRKNEKLSVETNYEVIG